MSLRTMPIRPKKAFTCSECLHRSFSSTRSAAAISPESPRYMTIPRPPQHEPEYRPRPKGILPKPRNALTAYPSHKLDSLMAQPAPSAKAPTPRLAFKRRQAVLRHDNLREGLLDLAARSARKDRSRLARSATNNAQRDAALTAKITEDERLTSTSLDASVVAELERLRGPRGHLVPDPDRAERVRRGQARVAALEAAKKSKRAEALHSLYMNARTFIVDAEGLDAAIDEAFGTVERPRTFKGEVPSMWNEPPPGMQRMLGHQTGKAGRVGVDSDQLARDAELLRNRVKRIAEGVTGGRMD